jgi:hypothetical protein
MLKYAVAIVLIAEFAGAARADKEYSYRTNNSFDGAAISGIKIDLDIGEISIVKSSGASIEVDYKNSVYAANETEAGKINDKYKFSAERSGDKLVIKVDLPHIRHTEHGIISSIINGDWSNESYPIIRVSIPEKKIIEINSSSADIDASEVNCDLDIRSASSDVSLENTTGNVDVDVASGDIDITGHKGQVTLNGQSSDFRITDIEGNFDGHTSSGDASLDKVKGSVQLSTTSGDCRAYDIDGNLDISSTSGDIIANGISGSVRAQGVSGDIRLSELSAIQGDFDVESVSGDVQMEVSRDFQGEVSLRSVSGDVNSRISAKVTYEDDHETSSHSKIQGTVGQGKGRLSVVSTSGDITVDRF